MSDDDGVTRRNAIYGIVGAVIGAPAATYVVENEEEIDRKGAEANYMGKNTDMGSVEFRSLDIDFYPQQKSGGNEASGLKKIGNKLLDGIKDDVLDNGILERGASVLADVNPAPVDGGGQYQGNAASTGYSETAKDPVTGFGEPNTIDTPNANIPPVSLNGRTAVAGNGSMEVYDQSGEEIASFDRGTESVPLLLDGGSRVVGSDSTGAYLYDIDNKEQIGSAPSDIAANRGSIKLLNNGTIGIQSAGNVAFLESNSLNKISTVDFATAGLRNFAFASESEALCTGEKSVRKVNPNTGDTIWQKSNVTGNQVMSSGAATDGDVYVPTDTAGRAHILDLEDGDKIKTLDIGQKPSASSPVFDADGNLYTATERITKFNDSYEEKWRTPLDSRATVTSGIDNTLIASTISSVQMLDKGSGEIIDTAPLGDAAKAAGMPGNGAFPVTKYGSDADELLEIAIERNEPNQNEPASAYIDRLDLQGPEDAIPVGETAQLTLNAAIRDNAPAPVQLTYELVVRHEGEQGILKDTTIGQPDGTTTEHYPVITESSEQDAVTTNGTAIDWDVNFEASGSETARANATTTNSTFSN